MIYKIISILCVFLLSVACTGADSTTTPILIPHNDHDLTPVLDIYIGDKGPYKFLIDTGATQSSITRDLADEVGLSYQEQSDSSTLTVIEEKFQAVTEIIDLYISDQKIKRRTNLFITEDKFNLETKARGILGISAFQTGVLENDPINQNLILSLPSEAKECDISNKQSGCLVTTSDFTTVPFSLGSHHGNIIIDTGHQAGTVIGFFKSLYTNKLWHQYHQDLPIVEAGAFSDRPLRFLRTNNFSLNGKSCLGEVLIRDPEDKSPLYDSTVGYLGWAVLKYIPFKIDYKNEDFFFNMHQCPYANVKTIGINGIYTSKDFRYMYIDGIIAGSPADRSGLKLGDQVEKIILSDGNVLTKFDITIINHNDQHVYAPVGSKVTYFVRRDDELIPFVMTAEGPPLVELD